MFVQFARTHFLQAQLKTMINPSDKMHLILSRFWCFDFYFLRGVAHHQLHMRNLFIIGNVQGAR